MMYKAELIKGVIDGVYDKDDVIKYCSTLSDIKPLYAELLCTQQRLMNAEEDPFVVWGADAEFSTDESEFAKYIANHAQNPVTGEWEQLNHNYELERVEDAISIVEELMREQADGKEPHQAEPHQAEQAPKKPQESIEKYIIYDDKERLVQALKKLVQGKKGKTAAVYIAVAVTDGYMRKPTFDILENKLGVERTRQAFNTAYDKYMKSADTYSTELNPARAALKRILESL